MALAGAACSLSFFVRQSLQRHPVVAWSGTGSAGGRSEHQQLWPGSQDLAALQCEQTVSMRKLPLSAGEFKVHAL